jgi:hypothetical protein
MEKGMNIENSWNYCFFKDLLWGRNFRKRANEKKNKK